VQIRSAQISELYTRMMELRVALFERRVFETESQSVWFIRGLQTETRQRRQAETELKAERRRRVAAEATAEAIAREAAWPFMVPALLSSFLKLEGMVDEVEGI